MNRRSLLTLSAASPLLHAAAFHRRAARRIKAIALDSFAVFDPRPIAICVEELFPGKGVELTAMWRTRQFEYTWLRTLTNCYIDFWRVTEDALVYSAKMLKIELTEQQRQHLMRLFLELRPWPDAPAALKVLHDAGIRLVFLSNFTLEMLNIAVSASGLQNLFEPHLSTDLVRAYKPDPRAYRMAEHALKLQRNEILFAAFGGWDAAGAKAFGFTTFWVNRMKSPLEELGSVPDAIGTTLDDMLHFVLHGLNRGA